MSYGCIIYVFHIIVLDGILFGIRWEGILELQGWTDGMDPDSDPDLSLFIAVMTLVIGVMPLFIGIMTLIRGLVLRLMASLTVHAPQIVYITGMWSELK